MTPGATAAPARQLTDEQAAAVERRSGPLLLAANAGSGKTTVLVERLVRLATEDDVRPGNVLAITFTEKAAGELRARVRARFTELGERELATEAEGAWISTVHGFCMRVLKAHAIAAGLDPAFRVLDDREARGLREDAFERALAGFLDEAQNGHRAEALDLVAARTPDRLQDMVEAVHGELRSRGQTRPRLPEVPPAPLPDPATLTGAARRALAHLEGQGDGQRVVSAREKVERCLRALERGALDPGAVEAARFKPGNVKALGHADCAAFLDELDRHGDAVGAHRAHHDLGLLDELLGRYADAYAAAKRAAGAVDFDDLELLTRDLLRDEPAVAAAYRRRFQRVMVDEFQDTNPLQLELLRLLDSGHTFVVGDELQSIYGFRHADVEVFRAERRRLGEQGATATLARNFRSAPEVLGAVNAAFTQVHGRGFTPLAGGRAPERGRPVDGPRVELLVTDTEGWDEDPQLAAAVGDGLSAERTWRCAEARLVAQRVADLLAGGGFEPRDVVVLTRAASDMATYEQALRDVGLPTLAAGAGGFWARRQVLDLCAHLAALANPRDEPALLSLLASPLASISPDGLVAIGAARRPGRRHEALEAPDDVLAAMPPGDARRLQEFGAWFCAQRAAAPRLGLDELLERAVVDRGYDLHVLGLPDGRRRLANVLKLARMAAQFELRRGRDVRAFIDVATKEVEDQAREAEAVVELGDSDAVRLMTMHASKGLEFPVVVCADLGRKPQLSSPELAVSPDGRVGLKLVDVRGGRADALALAELRGALRDRERREDERVHYVAMTRAEELLVVAGAVDLAKWPEPGEHGTAPIGWLAPALVPRVDARLREAADQEVVWERDGHQARVRLVRNAPDTVGEVLRLDADSPAPRQPAEQLALGVGGAAALPELPAPPPAGVATLSYSSLSAYAQCPYRWYLERVLRLPPETEVPPAVQEMLATTSTTLPEAAPGGLDPRTRGSIVHELLETLDLARPAVPHPAAIRTLAEAYEVELDDAAVADVQRLVRAFLGSSLRARLGAARSLRREHRFAFALETDGAAGPLVNGVVDVLAREEDGTALVVDYKTDDLDPAADVEDHVERAYGTQRRIYALAALRSGAPAVEVAHLYLDRPEAPVVLRVSQDDAPRLERELHALAEGLLAGRFPVAAEPHVGLCLSCPGRRALCLHPESRTLAPTAGG
ncbi:exodeoxyribonuclease V subunit beta [Conexibacter sp. SYSU D00693]|uniref:UvrD-helicase domain-containing protein n=1 Tax=Conexibacter sp. SYSU D00693 TaxID=2812560 RepID=UPI00196AFC45|nr:UvrD-helicase domain-containing protein [Conexibacter sp. SYSU D00693]